MAATDIAGLIHGHAMARPKRQPCRSATQSGPFWNGWQTHFCSGVGMSCCPPMVGVDSVMSDACPRRTVAACGGPGPTLCTAAVAARVIGCASVGWALAHRSLRIATLLTWPDLLPLWARIASPARVARAPCRGRRANERAPSCRRDSTTWRVPPAVRPVRRRCAPDPAAGPS